MIRSRAIYPRRSIFPQNAYRAHAPALIILTRRLQTQPTKGAPPKTPIPSPTNPQKPLVKLNPAPIKPPKSTAVPATSPPTASASRPNPPTVQTVSRVSITNLKETTAKDIADAESHGILTPPPEGAGWAKSTLHKAIQIAKFYFRGVKLVYSRGKMARAIKARVASDSASLERWEHRMIHIQDGDEKKLVPFVLIAIVLEEIIPLIAIWFPQMLPSTCILPSQRDRIQQGFTDAALAIPATWGPTFTTLTRAADSGEVPLDVLNDRNLVKALGAMMHLSGSAFTARRRIRKHLTFIQTDDTFLAKEDLRALSTQDLLQALRERGIITPASSHAEQVQQLSWWLKSVDENDSIARRIYLVALQGSR
ncbi:hypothetical protein K438DRAFT_1854209 [Mycena galopus ATCC 62051]|nr:hypothetical protein K438DRAFT_1854209 [Mycena galopus ATCC 62051]